VNCIKIINRRRINLLTQTCIAFRVPASASKNTTPTFVLRYYCIKHKRSHNFLNFAMEDTDAYMQQHFMTSPDGSVTDTSCYETSSEDGGGGSPWFGMNNISSFARSLGQNIDGIANAVNRGARILINEIAELENEAMRSDFGGSSVDSCVNDTMETLTETAILPLPWEICLQSTDADNMNVSIEQIVDEVLKERILSLSMNKETFSQPFVDTNKVSNGFCLDDTYVMFIRRLLEIDQNLGKAHAQLSGTSAVLSTYSHAVSLS